jgi:MFS family permease
MFKKHPSGLPFLFFTEMWERFGYYLMIGIFLLYVTDSEHGGLAMTRSQGSDIYGTFIALVYITPFMGGLLADKLLGFRRSIIIGGVLMGIGYLMLAIPNNLTTFYLSLFVIILGNGFFKPNISVLLGNLYNEDRYRVLKDTGYKFFTWASTSAPSSAIFSRRGSGTTSAGARPLPPLAWGCSLVSSFLSSAPDTTPMPMCASPLWKAKWAWGECSRRCCCPPS